MHIREMRKGERIQSGIDYWTGKNWIGLWNFISLLFCNSFIFLFWFYFIYHSNDHLQTSEVLHSLALSMNSRGFLLLIPHANIFLICPASNWKIHFFFFSAFLAFSIFKNISFQQNTKFLLLFYQVLNVWKH